MFRKLQTKAIFSLIAAVMMSLILVNVGMAAVWTDQADYAPGSEVIIHGNNNNFLEGKGYQTGETVSVHVKGPNGYTGDCSGVVDQSGSWSCPVTLWPDYLAVGSYTFTAIAPSGVSENGTFTDGNLKFRETGLPNGTIWEVTWNSTTNTASATNDVVFGGSGATASYTVKSPIQGGSGIQYIASPSAGVATQPSSGSSTVNIDFTTQYQVSFTASPSAGGSTSPSASSYYTNGSSINLAATSNTGYAFSSWTSNTGSIIFTNASSSSTTATINGSGTITANFVASCSLPAVTSILANQTLTYGSDALFTANAIGSPTPAVQWQIRSNSGTSWSDISSATTTSLTVNTPAVSQSGSQYRAVFTNSCGTANSNPATLTVSRKAASVTPNAASKTYGDPDPEFSGTLSGFLAADNVTAVYSRTSGEIVADPPYAISGTLSPASVLGNYDITYNTASFTINKATLTVTADSTSRTYGDANPTFTASYSGFKNSETLATSGVTGSPSLTTTADANSPVPGPYTITAALGTLAAGNYDFAFVNGWLTISARPITITADTKTKTYGDADPALTYTITSGNLVNGDTFSGALMRTAGESVASSPYAITQGNLALSSNYALTYVGANLTITPKPASVTPDAASKTYGDADPGFSGTLSGFLAADNVIADYSRTAGETVLGGPYTISATLSPTGVLGNYNITYNTASFTIIKATLTVTADSTDRIYGDPNPTFTAVITGFKNSETLASSGVTGSPSLTTTADATSSVPGPYTITAAIGTLAADNYDFALANGSLTINKATLTVTADDKSMLLHAALPDLTAVITGFKNSETLASSGVTGAPSLSTTATSSSPVGSYPISADIGTLAAGNYDFSFENGTLTISYAAGGLCYGAPGHQILQPIDADGNSVFKQKSTVPAKFRVCDANGVSIGTSGVVSSFKLVQVITNTGGIVNEVVDSTTPDTSFRWSATDQQWIFNINTKNLFAGNAYYYEITLNDGTKILFHFTLK